MFAYKVSCLCRADKQELNVIDTGRIEGTQELHKIRAHLLQYASLLEDFKQSVVFVQDTPNPVMTPPTNHNENKESRELMKKECQNLLTQIERLKLSREMWDQRLQNIMHLVRLALQYFSDTKTLLIVAKHSLIRQGFSSVNIQDSKRMQELTRATVRDSAAMKQIAYLTMVFFPATFSAVSFIIIDYMIQTRDHFTQGVFGMNIKEINPGTYGTLPHYFATTIPLTVLTTWVIVAFQGKWNEHVGEDISIWKRLLWPIMLVKRMRKKQNGTSLKGSSSQTPIQNGSV